MQQTETEHCTTLREFYDESRRQSNLAHGKHYCNYHDAISRYLARGERYKELGVFQGMSAAAACLNLPSSVELIDKNITKFNLNRHLFEVYCAENNIELTVIETGSTKPESASAADVLLVDSYHTIKHVELELAIHARHTARFMIFHDTTKPNDNIFRAVSAFANNSGEWEVVERNEQACGYTVLARI